MADFDMPKQNLQKDNRSMQEIMQAKREQTEAQIKQAQASAGQESVEARKARL